MIYGRAFTADNDERFLKRWGASLSALPMETIFDRLRNRQPHFICGDFHFVATGTGDFEAEFSDGLRNHEFGIMNEHSSMPNYIPVHLYMSIIGDIMYFSVRRVLSYRRRIIFVYCGGEWGLSGLPIIDPIVDTRFSYSTKTIWWDHQGKVE